MTDLHSVVSAEQAEAERMLIGSVIRDPKSLHTVGWLTEDAFMVPAHKQFWNRFLNGEDGLQITFSMPDMVDAITWSNDALFQRAGDYAQALYDKDQSRMALIAAEEIVKASREGDKDAVQAIAYSLASSQGGGDNGMRDPVDIGVSLNKRIDQGNISVPWGIASMDTATRGSEKGTLTVLAARPSMGKSSLAFQTCEHRSIDLGKKVGVWALEMSGEQMVARRTCHKVGAMWMDVRSENISAAQREDLKKHVTGYTEMLQEYKMGINDSTSTTVADIVRTQLRMRYDVLMVDHLGLLDDKILRGERHDQKIGRQTRMLHNLAKNTFCVVILVAQLNREVEQRKDKRPHMGDLRDSGEIEQNADNVGLMYGEWYYDTEADNTTEVIWGKYRDGVKNSLSLVEFNLADQQFHSVDTEDFNDYIDRQQTQPEMNLDDIPF
jgi:replicative DNA helicase